MAGLIDSTKQANTNLQKPNTSYDPAKATTQTMTADQRNVDSKSTVQGQLNGLLDKGGDYMKRAETKGLQMANKRGLLNSSFAVGAAHGAAMDAALPIAQQDAQTYNNQSLTNQAASNQANQFNAQSQNTTNLANQAADNRANEFNAGMQFDQWNAERGREADEFMQRLQQSGAMEKMSAEVSANLKGEYVKTWDKMRQDAQIAIQEIQNNPAIADAETKKAMIDQQIALLGQSRQAMESIFSSLPQWQQDWAAFTEV